MPDDSTKTAAEPLDPWFLAEFGCWTAVILAPILTWVNGPAVSTDQFVVRTAVFCLALAGGIGLSVARILRGRASRAAGQCSGRTTGETPSPRAD